VGHIVDTLLRMERLCRSVDALSPERYCQRGSVTIELHGLDEQHHLDASDDGARSSANADGGRAMLEHFPTKHVPAQAGMIPVCVAKMRPSIDLEPRPDSIGTEKAQGLQLFAHPATQPDGTAARIERACGTAFRVSFADLTYRNSA
jgi:hypothetical protein